MAFVQIILSKYVQVHGRALYKCDCVILVRLMRDAMQAGPVKIDVCCVSLAVKKGAR